MKDLNKFVIEHHDFIAAMDDAALKAWLRQVGADAKVEDVRRLTAGTKKIRIRTKYQRARFAAELARQLTKHQDRKVAAIATAIEYTLSAPIEIVNGKIAECSKIASDEIVAALSEVERE